MAASVPEGWRTARYGDLFDEVHETVGDRTDVPILSVTKNYGLMLASERFGKQIHSRDIRRYRLAPRDHIVADPMLLWSGTIGLQSVVDVGGVSPDYRVYRLRNGISTSFASMLVRSPPMIARYEGGARGTNVRRNRIARSDFLAIPVVTPPLAEQRKIAAILSSVDDAIEKTQAVIAQVQLVKKGLMQELLTRGLPGRHTKFKQTEIGEIPEDWEVKLLDELVAKPICYGVLKPGPHVNGGIPVVRIQDYAGNRLDLDKVQCSSSEIVAPYARSTLSSNDILISIRGTAGRLCIVPLALTGANISRDSARISLKDPELVEYVFQLLQAPAAQAFVSGEMRGLAVQGINIGDLRRLPVPVPPSEERRRITSVLDAGEANLRLNIGKRDELMRLKEGLMSVLLSGEVRVKLEAEAGA